MKRRERYDVCAGVISDLQFDARVWKEARSLAGDGRRVAVIGTVFDIEHVQRRRDPSGVEVCEIPLGRRDRPKSYPRRIYALLRVWFEILRTNARAYHAHDIHVVAPAWLASRIRRAKLIYDAHELWSENYRPSLTERIRGAGSRILERMIVRRSNAVITTNNSRAEALSKRYRRDDIAVLGNVPFLQERIEPEDPGYPPGKRVVLYLGRISAEGRAFPETIQSLTYLDNDVHFVIVGFGWDSERERIRSLAREQGVEDRVHLLAPLPFDQVMGAAAAATVGLVPIYGAPVSNMLGDTNKLHEYLMGGLPVVASDLPEIRRVVSLGDPPVGELFDAFSPESIAEAIRAVIDDPRYSERRSQARKLAEERFNWGVEERKLVALYREVLGEGTAAKPQEVLERA
jgi:glycosyltransferase involved in cell wall biosynthesis